MELARQGKITFDDDNVVISNLAMAITPTTSTFFIQFGSFEPITLKWMFVVQFIELHDLCI